MWKKPNSITFTSKDCSRLLYVGYIQASDSKFVCFFRHLPKIFDRYSSAEGFLFVEDDTILNYWNLLQADKSKIWTTDKVQYSHQIVNFFFAISICIPYKETYCCKPMI